MDTKRFGTRAQRAALSAFGDAASVVNLGKSEKDPRGNEKQEILDMINDIDVSSGLPKADENIGGETISMNALEVQRLVGVLFGKVYPQNATPSMFRSFGDRLRELRWGDISRLKEKDLQALSMVTVLSEHALHNGRIAELGIIKTEADEPGMQQNYGSIGRRALADLVYVVNNVTKISGDRNIPEPGVVPFDREHLISLCKQVDAYAEQHFAAEGETATSGEKQFYADSRAYIAQHVVNRNNNHPVPDLYFLKDVIVASAIAGKRSGDYNWVYTDMMRAMDTSPKDMFALTRKDPSEIEKPMNWTDQAQWTSEIPKGGIEFATDQRTAYGQGHHSVHFDPQAIGFTSMLAIMQMEKQGIRPKRVKK